MLPHQRYEDSLNKMDNAGYDRDGDRKGNVELGMVRPRDTTMMTANGNNGVTCSDHCLKLHQQNELQHKLHLQKSAQKPPESPWHHLKTIFLVGTIIFLVIWILVYTLLSQLNLL